MLVLLKFQVTYITTIGLHIFFGILIYFNESLAKLYFFVAIIYFISRILNASLPNKTQEVLVACAYFVGAEVFFRMTKGAVFYESSKYLVMFFMMMGIFYTSISNKAFAYVFYIALLIPSIVVASTTLSFDANFRTNIAFVLSGPICLGVAALFCYDKKVSKDALVNVLTYMLMPIVTLTTYLFLYAPSIKDVLSGTSSNFEASGGFGPNQVATALGIGMFAATVRLFMKSPTLLYRVINVLLLIIISYRAVVTFSRGGVIAAIMTIIAFLVIYYFSAKRRIKSQIIYVFFLFVIALSITWVLSSTQTMGLIDKRYANENAAGIAKEDITTGREQLFLKEIEGFINHPFLGIGASRAKDMRLEDNQRLASHNEISRTLSEHGLFGVMIFLILLVKPLVYRIQNKSNVYFYAFLVFWFATINHSSMRIAAPAFIYGLALLYVTNETPSLHRKQIKKLAH